MNLAFFVPCNPPTVTAQQKGAFAMKGGGVRFFTKAKVRQAENSLHALLSQHRPAVAFCGPITVCISFVFPWRKSEKKSRMKKFASYPIETRPDCDNISKSICDVMTTLRFWNDDSQISTLLVSKFYGDRPGIGVNITNTLATTREGEQVEAE